jgi:hypothetical protein
MLMCLVTIDWTAVDKYETIGSCAGHSEMDTISDSFLGVFQPRTEWFVRDKLHG